MFSSVTGVSRRKHAPVLRGLCGAALLLLVISAAGSDFSGFQNRGLVGAGRIPADTFDALGPGHDTLGGAFSSMVFDRASWKKTTNAAGGAVYEGTLYGLADRGAGGDQNFIPRIQQFRFSFTPYLGTARTNQTQIHFTNSATILLTAEGSTPFTGFEADDESAAEPRAGLKTIGQGHRSLDSEGLARLPNGHFFVSDEYGPFIYAFDPSGRLEYTLKPPAAYWPKVGNNFGQRSLAFSSYVLPDSGRKNNRGLEGLTLTPDGKKLVSLLQSPLVQDAGDDTSSRNTRLLIFDIDPGSATFKQPVAEFVYQLTLNGNADSDEQTLIGDITALNDHQFCVLEHDGRGLGGLESGKPLYKKVVLIDLNGATNIVNSGYDLEKGAPGQISFRKSALPANVRPVQRMDLVDLLDPTQLSKFRLNINADPNNNTLSEKWEGVAVVPAGDPAAPDDYFILVGNDNDFQADKLYHNGELIDSGATPIDIMLLAYRVTLPGYQAPAVAEPAAARLTIAPSGSGFELSWPEDSPGYQLQRSQTFSNWTDVSASSNHYSIVPTNRAEFFRLIRAVGN